MVTEARPWDAVNAWERWYVGWIDIDQNKDLRNANDNGLYTLDDFITTGDVIRIEIPNTNGQQHLWIENHQGYSIFDTRQGFDDSHGVPLPFPDMGVTMYIEDTRYSRGDIADPSFRANGMKIIHPGGNRDYFYDSLPKLQDWNWLGNKVYNFKSHTGSENPISGMSVSSQLRFDFDTANGIAWSNNYNSGGNNELAEITKFEGNYVYGALSPNVTFSSGEKVGLSHNPIITNYPDYNPTSERLGPIYLSLIHI